MSTTIAIAMFPLASVVLIPPAAKNGAVTGSHEAGGITEKGKENSVNPLFRGKDGQSGDTTTPCCRDCCMLSYLEHGRRV